MTNRFGFRLKVEVPIGTTFNACSYSPIELLKFMCTSYAGIGMLSSQLDSAPASHTFVDR